MAMDRTEYPAMLATLQPGQAVDVLTDRVRQVGKLNTEIADWLQERRRLEELYSNGLRKLARKNITGADLGVFTAPWSTLTNSAEALADSHSALASKIEVDVERPLRDFVGSNREMQAMTNMQGNLNALARDVDRAQQKTDKLQGRGERVDAGKVASASSELDSAQAQWESQAPYVFESLQAADETRWNHLRDVLTQFQTHEVDQVEKHRVSAEGVLNVLLNVETIDEIKTFALRTVENKPSMQRNRPSTAASAIAASGSAPSRSGELSAPPTPSLQPPEEDARSASVPEEKKKNPLRGLKRLGTVMGRRRESKMPQQLQPMSESPERPAKSSPFNSFGRLGRSKDQAPTLEPPSESSDSRRPHSPLRAGSEVMEPPRASQEPTSPSPAEERHEPSTNGIAAGVGGAALGAAGGAALASNFPNGSHQGDLADLEPPKPVEAEPAPNAGATAEPEKDSEGYSVPPSQIDAITQAQRDAEASDGSVPPQFNVNIRNAPIQEEQTGDADAALASMASKLQMQAPQLNNRRLGTVRGRREARNSYIPPAAAQGIPETSRSPGPPSPGPASPPVEQPTVEREMPAAEPTPAAATSPFLPAFQPAPAGQTSPGQAAASAFSPFPSTEPTSPVARPASRTAQLQPDHTGDNHSIRSGRSLGSTTSQSHRHPELSSPGLNASIIETLNARFESSQLTSSSLTGEIALAYNPADFTTPFSTETLRLDNFATLDKVAPNPAFISPAADKQGEYAVNLGAIPRPQVAFKYQARLDPSHGASQPPLLISPAFKVEPTQASVIVSYSLNPAFTLPIGRTALTLSNVVLALTLEGAKASSCLSKPVGNFAREKNLIFWPLGDITLSAGGAPTKLLARFATTEGETATGGAVEARWEIAGEEVKGVGSALGVSVAGQKEGADPFADEDANGAGHWREVGGVRKLVGGSYVAK